MQVKHCCVALLVVTSLGEIFVSKGKMDSYNINCIVCGNNGQMSLVFVQDINNVTTIYLLLWGYTELCYSQMKFPWES